MHDLNVTANQFLSNYGLNLKIPIVINHRLRRALGMFVYNRKLKVPLQIELSKMMLEIGDIEVIKDTLHHECLHYALFIQNKPHDDEDEYFIKEAKRLNVGLTDEVFVGYKYVCKCSTCENEFITEIKNHINKKLIGSKYRTSCCKSDYQHLKTVVCDGVSECVI